MPARNPNNKKTVFRKKRRSKKEKLANSEFVAFFGEQAELSLSAVDPQVTMIGACRPPWLLRLTRSTPVCFPWFFWSFVNQCPCANAFRALHFSKCPPINLLSIFIAVKSMIKVEYLERSHQVLCLVPRLFGKRLNVH